MRGSQAILSLQRCAACLGLVAKVKPPRARGIGFLRTSARALLPRRHYSRASEYDIPQDTHPGTEVVDEHVYSSPYPDVKIPEIPFGEYIFSCYDNFGTKQALTDFSTGQTYTYAQLKDATIRVASGLTKLGYRKGDVIAIYSTNNPEFNLLMTACAAVGIVLTTANPAYTSGELARHLEDSGASALVVVSPLVPNAQAAINSNANVKHNIKDIITIGTVEGMMAFSTLIENDGKSFPENVDISPKEDLLVMPYSSGTTGLPKGVMLTHFNLVANLHQIQKQILVTPEDNTLGVLPCYHIYGMVPVMYGSLQRGAHFVTVPKFDPEMFLKAIQEHKITQLHLVPPIVLFMAKHPVVSKFDLSSLNKVVSGAAPLGESVSTEFMNRLKAPICQGYGLTETTPVLNLDEDPPHLGTVGKLVPNTHGKIVDPETGKVLGMNQLGEIRVKGPQNMKGYLNNQKATDDMIDKDGWLRTGDIGFVNDVGCWVVEDRLKELIKYKGFQVPPAELEDLLFQHPGVQDVAVIGIPDDEAGELPRAYIVQKPDVKVTEEDLQQFVEKNVAAYKKLRGGVQFTNEIPKSPSGKILRRILKESLFKS